MTYSKATTRMLQLILKECDDDFFVLIEEYCGDDFFVLIEEYCGEGICGVCANIQGGVEPDAIGYECHECGEMAVEGIEQAIVGIA